MSEICSYTDFTIDKLYIRPVDKSYSNISYLSIKSNNKKDLLFVLTPWTETKYSYSGLVTKTFNKEPIEFPTHFKIDLDVEDDSHLDFINKLRELDTYFKSNEFKNKYLGSNYKGQYYPMFNETHNTMKASLQHFIVDDKKKLTTLIYNTFSYPTKPHIFYKKEVTDIDDPHKLNMRIKRHKHYRCVLIPASIWYHSSGYGVQMKISEIHIGTNKPDFNYSENN